MKKVFYTLCFFIFLGFGCRSSNQSAQQNTRSNTPSEHYTSSFPYKDVSKQLQKIQASILRFTATGFYDTYFFTDRNITIEELRQNDHTQLASRTITLDQSKAGTAISLLQNNDRTVLITAQHILAFPDTVIVYKKGQNIPKQTFVESMGIKDRQRNYLYTGNQILSLDILAEDVYKDLALVEIETPPNDAEASPLNINIGRAKDLQLGSFLYVLGFPLGSPMVTRGIVSAPDFDNGGRFLTDALFNHGISGGLIIATRNNFDSFEWVGMAVTASAIRQQFLIPDPAKKNTYENFEAYTDTALVSEQRLINYGLTQATPIEQIIAFLLINEDTLNRLGFSITNLTDQ